MYNYNCVFTSDYRRVNDVSTTLSTFVSSQFSPYKKGHSKLKYDIPLRRHSSYTVMSLPGTVCECQCYCLYRLQQGAITKIDQCKYWYTDPSCVSCYE